jgi:hypothetical protein
MTHELLDPSTLRGRGFDVLVDQLGWVNAVRFMQEFETSRLDYTSDRDAILPAWSAEELLQHLREASHARPGGQ